MTEGGTASLMALYADVDSISRVGPVGPGRDLLLQAALPLNAVPVHIDKNIYAANLLNTLAYQDLDGYHVGKTAFAFDQSRQGRRLPRGKLLVYHRRADSQRPAELRCIRRRRKHAAVPLWHPAGGCPGKPQRHQSDRDLLQIGQ